MADRNLELALRIKSDFDQSVKELRGVQKEIEGVGQSARRAQLEVDRADIAGKATRQAQQLEKAMRKVTSAAGDLVKGNVHGATEKLAEGAGRAALGFGALGVAILGVTALIGTYAVAVFQAAKEQSALQRALIETGGYVGKTAEELGELADALDNMPGTTGGEAAAAIAAVVGTGKIAGETLERAAAAALSWENATGTAVDKTIAQFERLQDKPVEALLELNERMHFLTQAQLDHVRLLQDEGREAEAAAEASRIYAGALEDRAGKIIASLGSLQSAWRGLKDVATDAWDAVVGVGREDTVTSRLLNTAILASPLGPTWQFLVGRGRQGANAGDGTQEPTVDSKEARAKIEADRKATEQAERDWAAFKQQNLDLRQRQIDEEARIVAAGERLGLAQAEIDEQIAASRARFAEAEARRNRGGRSAPDRETAAQREVANLQKQIALLGLLEEGETRVSTAARIRYEIQDGIYKSESPQMKARLQALAEEYDAKQKGIEASRELKEVLERARAEYDQLQAALQTPIEAGVESVTDRIRVLNEAMAQGIIGADKYVQGLSRIFDLEPMELLAPRAQDRTGLQREQSYLDAYAAQLRNFYQLRTQIIEAGRANGQASEEFWRQQELALETQHNARLADLQKARADLALSSTASMFDSMAEIARAGAGEQSEAYQILFAISKGFAVAQAAVALAQNVAEASKVGFPQNLPLIAAAFAQGAQIASILSSAQFDPGGYAEGGFTGPGGKYQVAGYVHKGEGVLNQEEISALGGPRGFYALREAIADGTLHYDVSDAPVLRAAPSYNFASGGIASDALPTPELRLNLINAFDVDDAIARYFNGPKGDKTYLNAVGRNRTATKNVVMR